MDTELGGGGLLDDHAHGAQGVGCGDVVFAVRECRDMAGSFRDGSKKKGSMADALVRWDRHLSNEGA
jgi:hypothetical protein